MKNLKQIISIILFVKFGVSAVLNILFLFGKVTLKSTQIGVLILMSIIFLVSVLGIILKNIRKDEIVSVNIITPAKELGILYTVVLIIWAVSYFIVMIFK